MHIIYTRVYRDVCLCVCVCMRTLLISSRVCADIVFRAICLQGFNRRHVVETQHSRLVFARRRVPPGDTVNDTVSFVDENIFHCLTVYTLIRLRAFKRTRVSSRA